MQPVARRLAMYPLLLLLFLLAGLPGCGTDKHPLRPLSHQRGEIVQSQPLDTLTASELQQLLAARQIQVPFALTHSVAALSVRYYTVDARGTQTIASGALVVPLGASNLPLVSIQHGTQSKRDLVASVSPLNSTEGIVGLIMASMGYAVVVPDYLGFGVSGGVHPYLHANSLAPSVIDLMRAARAHGVSHGLSLSGRVFLTGYSEGGYATLATQKAIEEQHATEFDLTAVAPMSGPYDIAGMMQAVFRAGAYAEPAYIAYGLTAYNDVYGWDRLDEFFNAPYASVMPGLFDGSKTWAEVTTSLPTTFAALMKPPFVSAYLDGSEPALSAAFRGNTLLEWTPRTPIHFFHGDADEIVPIAHALAAVDSFTSRGATSVQLTTIPGGTHETTGPYAVIGAIQWFESVRGAPVGVLPTATQAVAAEHTSVMVR